MASLGELQDAIARHAGEGFTRTCIPRLALMRRDRIISTSESVYAAWLLVVAQGRVRLMLGPEPLELDAARYAVTSVDLPLGGDIREASPSHPYLGAALGLQPELLASVMHDMGAQLLDRPPSAGMAVGSLGSTLLDPLTRLVQLLDHPRDIAMLAPMIEREILYHLLLGEQAGMLRQLALSDSRLSRINRAINHIRREYAAPMRVELLARRAGMSLSSLHRHFKAVTGMSPLQYQKRLRLQEARRRLSARQDSAASIAYAVGYESASQFSRDYRRLFGVPPSRDAVDFRDRLLGIEA
ncbi:AraC family transcriptional regulator [Stenotrophomonas sp.]|uniref:AraC family transcriptional regulator n=1 Tax=Stenotrophomonas sp. TaxID=69392 RepID=UPI0028AE8C67|nr:AraC family transcriptional regulator [Stenotrophomonas sp.]